MQSAKRFFSVLFSVFLLFSFFCAGLPAHAASGPQLKTTLQDGVLQRGSRKTFDVWASNSAGQKIKCIVELNGQELSPTWDDTEKTSYTLRFTEEGENLVTVSATSDGGQKAQLSYHIRYQRANPGEYIGSAIFSVEAFTIGCGYIIEPVSVPIYEGETSAYQLLRLLHQNGLVGYYGGDVDSAFYLAYIADGGTQLDRYNNYQNSRKIREKIGAVSSPRSLGISPSVPALLRPYLEKTMTFYDPDDYAKNWTGYLGEFALTNGSGWMYCINHVFPNVGFADSFLSDGDVVRVQFTLGYGADIGGFGAIGTEIPDVTTQPSGGYYSVANKDSLTKAICRARQSSAFSAQNVKAAYEQAVDCMATLNASQSAVNAAANTLQNAVANPVWESETTTAASAAASSAGQDTSVPSRGTGHLSSEKSTENKTGATENSNAEEEEAFRSLTTTDEKSESVSNQTEESAQTSKEQSPKAAGGSILELSVGILVGVLLLCGIAAVLFFLWRRRKRMPPSKNDEKGPNGNA